MHNKLIIRLIPCSFVQTASAYERARLRQDNTKRGDNNHRSHRPTEQEFRGERPPELRQYDRGHTHRLRRQGHPPVHELALQSAEPPEAQALVGDEHCRRGHFHLQNRTERRREGLHQHHRYVIRRSASAFFENRAMV